MSKPYKPKYLRHALLILSGLPIQIWGGKQESSSAKRSERNKLENVEAEMQQSCNCFIIFAIK